MPTTYAIPNGRTVMDATLYTGTGSNGLVVNNADIGTQGFYPDLIWIKSRNAAYYNTLLDYPRGASVRLFSNLADGESNNGCQSSFNTNGFTLNADAGGVNNSGTTYVAWQWNAGSGTTSSNTSGSITSTVDVNTTAGFSIVKYTGTGSASTVGHGLGVAPNWVIVKQRNASADWVMRCNQLSGNDYTMLLNSTATQSSYSPSVWNNTAPTSSVFSIGTNSAINTNGNTYVAYCFAPVAGYSAMGSYTGNGSTDGPFIYTGFRPTYLMVKNISSTNDWAVFCSAMSPYNVEINGLKPNSSSAEYSGYNYRDFLSNGFKLRNADSDVNANGSTYIYMAFAENPFAQSNAV